MSGFFQPYSAFWRYFEEGVGTVYVPVEVRSAPDLEQVKCVVPPVFGIRCRSVVSRYVWIPLNELVGR